MNDKENLQTIESPFRHLGYTFAWESGVVEIADTRLTDNATPIHVTSKPWDFYRQIRAIPEGQLEHVMNSDAPVRVLNIGAGLDNTTDLLDILKIPPVIIDPLRRRDLSDGLALIAQSKISSRMAGEIARYQRRLSLLQSSRVLYIPQTFEEAVIEHESSLGADFDVVIDFTGAAWSASLTHMIMKNPLEVKEKERSLLDPHGLGFYWNL